MKFECKRCVEPCKLDICDGDLAPFCCPYGFEKSDWNKVAEPSALPKLTAEALAERGIEWPEWAECAVVAPSGWGLFATTAPCLSADKEFWLGGGIRLSIVHGKWDTTDWQNSKIMRPKKGEKPQLPDWIKVGAWAAVGNFVGKIDWISRDGSECRITSGESRFAKRDEVKPVTWRAWTAKEAELQVGKPFRFKRTRFVAVMIGVSDQKGVAFPASGEHHNVYFASLDELFEQGEQLNGLPCGVPQVEGVDLEG